jgi:hypothetical protein
MIGSNQADHKKYAQASLVIHTYIDLLKTLNNKLIYNLLFTFFGEMYDYQVHRSELPCL